MAYDKKVVISEILETGEVKELKDGLNMGTFLVKGTIDGEDPGTEFAVKAFNDNIAGIKVGVELAGEPDKMQRNVIMCRVPRSGGGGGYSGGGGGGRRNNEDPVQKARSMAVAYMKDVVVAKIQSDVNDNIDIAGCPSVIIDGAKELFEYITKG